MGLPQALWSLGWGRRLECILMLLVPLTLEGHIHAQLLLLYIYMFYIWCIYPERDICVSVQNNHAVYICIYVFLYFCEVP